MNRPLAPRQQQLLKALVDAAGTLTYAIGGAVAMHAHGMRRQTQDVDAFVLEEDRQAFLRALRKAGLEVVPVMSPFHYAAYLPPEPGEDPDPEERIDVLVPAGEPELSAIEFSEEMTIGAVQHVPVFPIDLLVATKFYSDRRKDERDIADMLDRGLFDVPKVEAIIRSFDDEGADDFLSLVKSLQRPPTRKRPLRKPR